MIAARDRRLFGRLFFAHRLWLAFAIFMAAAFSPLPANAHEVRPALLELTETQPGEYDVLWKQPVTDGKTLRLTPLLPAQCQAGEERINRFAGNVVAQRWQVICPLDTGRIKIDGLERSLTDVFVRIVMLDGGQRNQVLRPDAAIWDLETPASGLSGIGEYLLIGAEHMLFGFDHLLFVLGLTLLVAKRQIIAVITSFTIAHSITLALTVFDVIALRSAPVELLIAASIVLLAVENIRKKQGKETLAARRPWLIAFVIGLIHGLGFAGALSDIGLPIGDEALALALFNIGLELGQIAFVGLILLILALLRHIGSAIDDAARITAIYFIGAIGCYWCLDRFLANLPV